ncbi:MAG TPA: DUF2490 domain-containing protein [Bryobacteraceae bacterium]|nr:DUF2490 domain-containing protein [Bryobacteraceae bacterium]
MIETINRWLLCSALTLLSGRALHGQSNPVTNEYRVAGFSFYPMTENLSGFGYLGYVNNPQGGYSQYHIGYPGFEYTLKPWLEIWGALIGNYVNNRGGKEDTFELRPFIGAKFEVANKRKIEFFDFTRYEARNLYSHDTRDWSLENRIRSRFGSEIPLATVARAWKPQTFYTLLDVEPFWVAGKGLTMVRFRAGLGYIPNDRLRVEFVYHTQWGEATGSDALVYNQNIFPLNVKIGLRRSILSRVWNPGL